MNIKIRKINLEEYELVVEMFNKYRIFYKQPSNIELAKTYIYERLQNKEAHIFIAFNIDNQSPIGFTLLYPKFSSVSTIKNWHIGDLFVEMESRKKGVGEKLLQASIEFSGKENAHFVTLNTAVDNYTAQSLYENFGFTKQEPLTGYFAYQYTLS